MRIASRASSSPTPRRRARSRTRSLGIQTWKEIVSALRAVGYDGVLSIEHEDPLMSIEEGMRKGVAALREILISEPAPKMWWA